MRMFSLSRPVLMALAAGPALACAVASCSLGLDESLIDRSKPPAEVDAGTPEPVDAAQAEASAPDAATAVGCTTDADCKPVNACVKAHCDVPRRRCIFDVCRVDTCSSATCETPAGTCGAPKPYKLRAAVIGVGTGVGCGGVASRCIVAVHPFLFVGTTNGPVAYLATDPGNANPPKIPITGLGFLPVTLLASGARVFFVGAPAGSGSTLRVPLAWIDVPSDPFTTKLDAHTVLAFYNRPSVDYVFPSGTDALLLQNGSAPAGYPATLVTPPLTEPTELGSLPIPVSNPLTVPVATSGSTLVVQTLTTTGAASFAVVANVGTATAASSGDVPLTAAGSVSAPQTFGIGPDGSVVWAHAALTGPLGTAPAPTVRAARAFFLVADANANVDGTLGLDLETYAPTLPLGTNVVGPSALLDGTRALVTAALAAAPTQTGVQFATRQPLGLVRNADNSPRKFPIPVPVANLGAAASNGIGYVLTSESPSASSVYVFDPSCAP